MAANVLSIIGCIFGFIAFLAMTGLRRTRFKASLTSIGVIATLSAASAGFAYGFVVRYPKKETSAAGAVQQKCYLGSDSKPETPGIWKAQIDEAGIVRKYRRAGAGEVITPKEFERRYPNGAQSLTRYQRNEAYRNTEYQNV
jgi:hypothetical protein